ncbi:glycosyltransferase family 4 protein [Sphingomonas sp. PR090111-T3T-6A]|uniref:glycosyltransferase family 4 protein n=1 Tax=Sphingomonas sp. PR090111-T3T-6A TaxID=685778 RepID=UPI000378521C|nr:glycosyltransferase family 4 protein [Sphingomonas sp. PR090111-T3T-6A]
MPGLAALQYVSTEFDTTGPRLLGRHSASEGFLKAWARHAGADPLTCWTHNAAEGEHFAKKVAAFGSTGATARAGIGAERALIEAGALWLADPSVGAFTWHRRAHGQKLWSIVGITHTTASDNTMDRIAALMTTPVQSWDALICTSKSVLATVTTMLEAQKEYFAARLGAQRFDTCQLPVIPLGVHCDDFATTPENRTRWREELGIPEDAVAILQVARLALFGKAHPVPLYLALDAAARKAGRKVHLILAGWFSSPQQEAAFQAIADQFAETIVTHVVDGRRADVRRTIWAAADIFTLLVDNIQETFGLAPVEAMAAGLPVVVSDWDGFRDTVAHGETGFLIPTMQPLPGAGSHLTLRYALGIDEYNGYIGAAAQSTSIDLAHAAEAFEALITDATLRAAMGHAARRHARRLYDWPVVIGQYRDLLGELAERRKAATGETAPLAAGKPFRPDRGDPYTLFESYPTAPLGFDLPIRRLPGGPAEAAAVAGGLEMTMAAPHLLPAPARLDAILARLDAGDATLRTLFDAFPEINRRILTAGVMWLIKYGFATTAR